MSSISSNGPGPHNQTITTPQPNSTSTATSGAQGRANVRQIPATEAPNLSDVLTPNLEQLSLSPSPRLDQRTVGLTSTDQKPALRALTEAEKKELYRSYSGGKTSSNTGLKAIVDQKASAKAEQSGLLTHLQKRREFTSAQNDAKAWVERRFPKPTAPEPETSHDTEIDDFLAEMSAMFDDSANLPNIENLPHDLVAELDAILNELERADTAGPNPAPRNNSRGDTDG
jgi:hypothetical protein